MKKLLMAVDGSESSKNAARKVAEMAGPLGAEVSLITVVHTPPVPSVSAMPENIEEWNRQGKEVKEEGKAILAEAEEIMKEQGLEVEKILRQGDPAHLICEEAEKGYDLIALSDKGLGKVKRFFLGSITDKVVRHASVSVLVIK